MFAITDREQPIELVSLFALLIAVAKFPQHMALLL